MQATASTTVDTTSAEDIDGSAWWSTLWLSGWDCWAEAYLNEQIKSEAVKVAIPRRTRSVRSGQRGGKRNEGASAGQDGATQSDSLISPSTSETASTKSNDAHVCSTCGKTLSSQNALRLHSKTHEGGRPWKCEECGACFARKDHLRVHYRVHTGERPYSCMICGNSFAHSGTLKSHIRTHTGEKPFACDECGVCFSDPSTLRMHRLKHAGVKAFVCSDCGRAFASNGILNKHKRVHPNGGCAHKKGRPATATGRVAPNHRYIGEQLIPCDICGRIFKSEQSLNCHMKNHADGVIRSQPSEDEVDVEVEDSENPCLPEPEGIDVEEERMDEKSDDRENDSDNVNMSDEKSSDIIMTDECSNGTE